MALLVSNSEADRATLVRVLREQYEQACSMYEQGCDNLDAFIARETGLCGVGLAFGIDASEWMSPSA